MRGNPGASTISPLAAAAALSLCYTSEARAGGGGGENVGNLLGEFCRFLGITSCPQMPTVTQRVLEIAGLQNTAPDYVRGPVGVAICSIAGNPFNPPTGSSKPPCATVALNAVNPPKPSTIGVSDLASLTPLAFTLNKQGQAVPTDPTDHAASAFFYAFTTEASGQPDMLDLVYDYPLMTSANFMAGQTVAAISLPLQVLSTTNGSERLVCGAMGCPASVATLQVTALCSGGPDCLSATVIGDFSTPGTLDHPSPSPAALGLQWSVSFSPSPNSSRTHAIFMVQVPLLVTGPSSPAKCGQAISAGTPDLADCGNDPSYFGVVPANATIDIAAGTPTGINQITGAPTAFSTNDLGFTPAFLGQPVGIAPSAAPAVCVGNTCTPTSTYPFCASFLVKRSLTPATAAFYSISTDGTANVSAPVSQPAGVKCPF